MSILHKAGNSWQNLVQYSLWQWILVFVHLFISRLGYGPPVSQSVDNCFFPTCNMSALRKVFLCLKRTGSPPIGWVQWLLDITSNPTAARRKSAMPKVWVYHKRRGTRPLTSPGSALRKVFLCLRWMTEPPVGKCNAHQTYRLRRPDKIYTHSNRPRWPAPSKQNKETKETRWLDTIEGEKTDSPSSSGK